MERRVCFALAVATLTVCACAPPPSDDPTMMFTGGVIYPLVDGDAPVTSLAIRGDSILAVGGGDDILPLAGEDTLQMRLDGAVLLPGAYDGWVDLEALGRWDAAALDLRLTSSIEEVQAMVRNAAGDGSPDDRWLVGWGWDENDWPTPTWPTGGEIEALGVSRPVALMHRNGRVAWVNDEARAALSVAPSTAVVSGAALAALRATIAGSAEQRGEWIAAGSRLAAASGLTHVATTPVDMVTTEALLQLEYRDLLPLRVDVRLSADAATAYAAAPPPSRLASSALVRVAGVGVRLDGPLASRLAALREPYAVDVDASPLEPYDEALRAAVDAAATAALPLAVHASGDAAVAAALAAIGRVGAGGELIGADLLPEPASDLSGIRVSLPAARFSRDVYWLDRILGAPRSARAHAWGDLFAAGATLRFASDAPAGYLRPLTAVASATSRQDPTGYPAGGWNPAQALSPSILLRALVADAELIAGAPADLVVWSEDPLAGDVTSLRRAEALLTLVAGRVAYSRALINPYDGAEGR